MVPDAERAANDELLAYTLTHDDPAFIHQYVVDAWAAQRSTDDAKPIVRAFALIGLCLHLERGWTGRQVQLAHMRLARGHPTWPRFSPPADLGAVTAIDVLAAAPGHARDEAIEAWCASVWAAWRGSHDAVARLVAKHGE